MHGFYSFPNGLHLPVVIDFPGMILQDFHELCMDGLIIDEMMFEITLCFDDLYAEIWLIIDDFIAIPGV